MAKTECICSAKTTPLPERPQYPTLTPDSDPLKLFHENGYFVVRGLFSPEEVEQNKAEISSVVREWYEEFQKTKEDGKDWESIANRLPAWKEGRMVPENPELGIRRLYRMALRNQLFARMCRHEKVGHVTNHPPCVFSFTLLPYFPLDRVNHYQAAGTRYKASTVHGTPKTSRYTS